MPDIKSKVEENTKDIGEIKQSIETIKNNHLYHIEKDMERQTKQIEKIDNRIWWVLGILVVSTVIGMISDGL
jgi:hypothetical protein